MHPKGPHCHIGAYIGIPLYRLSTGPNMVGKIRCAIGEVVRVEEGERIYQDHGGSHRNEQSNHRVPRSVVAVSSESISNGMLGIEDGGRCCPTVRSVLFRVGKKIL